MRENPVIIFCSPRGGSSLVAGVFVAHGWWVGETYSGTPYTNHENAVIKDFLKKNFKLDAGIPDMMPGRANLRKAVGVEVPPYDDWMFKGPAEYYPIFDTWFPKMTPVFVFRDLEQAVEGVVRRRGEGEREKATQIIDARYKYMQGLLDQGIGFRVDADAVVRGDLTQVETIIKLYGIEMDHGLAMSTIDPSRFHM